VSRLSTLRRLWSARLVASLCVLAAVLGGCGRGVSESQRRVARAVVDVVERNMAAAETRDAPAYCATFTGRYLRDHFRGGYATCVHRFRGPAAAVERSTDVRYLNASPSTDRDALVHYALGKARKLDYVMKLTAAPPGSPRGTRWLIDARAPLAQG
jgi:hypothetical protein